MSRMSLETLRRLEIPLLPNYHKRAGQDLHWIVGWWDPDGHYLPEPTPAAPVALAVASPHFARQQQRQQVYRQQQAQRRLTTTTAPTAAARTTPAVAEEWPPEPPRTFARVVEDNQARANGTYRPPTAPQRPWPDQRQRCETCRKLEGQCRCGIAVPLTNTFEAVVALQRRDGRLA